MHVLLTPRLTLRPPAVPDAEDIALWLSDRAVARMLGPVPHPYDVADAEAWIARAQCEPNALVYTIHRERLIGVVSLEGDMVEPRLGYWLAAPHHGRGLMTEAAGALLDHAFSTRSVRAVRSSVFADNPASVRVQEKLGFTVTGADEAWSLARAAAVGRVTTRLDAKRFTARLHEAKAAA